MKTFITHPDNLEAIRKRVEREVPADSFGLFWGPNVKTNPLMDRDRPSGKYKMPDGRIIPLADICIRERFITYGPEDVRYLVYAGIITEEREMLVYEMDESAFRMRFDYFPKLHMPRAIITGGFA